MPRAKRSRLRSRGFGYSPHARRPESPCMPRQAGRFRLGHPHRTSSTRHASPHLSACPDSFISEKDMPPHSFFSSFWRLFRSEFLVRVTRCVSTVSGGNTIVTPALSEMMGRIRRPARRPLRPHARHTHTRKRSPHTTATHPGTTVTHPGTTVHHPETRITRI